MSFASAPRRYVIWSIFTVVALIIIGKLLYLQLFQDKYKILADDIAIYRKVVYPPRGVIYDRKGNVMLYNKVVYDLMVTANNVPKDIDTLALCRILEIDTAEYSRLFHRAKVRNGPLRKSVMMEQLSQAQTARLQENIFEFPGFELGERYIRTYPDSAAAHILGYIGEISKSKLKTDRYRSYRQGDYIGISGLEYHYEEVLRGQRGIHFLERDNFNRPTDPYKKGALDTPEVAGRSLELYLDAELQKYGEQLMQNKIGGLVAIEPKTGGIIAMVSAPSYDPNMLSGRKRAANFSNMYVDPRHPLLNRAIRGFYNPGSTMKPMTALVALDAGVITPSFGFACGGGYYNCGRRLGCTHSGGGHAANLRLALANSCNAYFVHIFRKMVDAEKFGGVKNGVAKWYEYNYNFGFGHPTGVDMPFELGGTLPDTGTYNRIYPAGTWNSCNIMFVGMGQGEIALTPLQLANAMCIIANKGYYYTPHMVKTIGGAYNDTMLNDYHEKHVVTNISNETYQVVIDGMHDVVLKGTGRVADLDSIKVCAKTGTVENKARIGGKVIKMKDHSVFVAFAPKDDPRIAIAVVVENAGYGATWAGPVASLMMEKYLTDTIATKRKFLETKLLNANLVSPYVYEIDREQKYMDSIRYHRRLERERIADSTKRARDSVAAYKLYDRIYGK